MTRGASIAGVPLNVTVTFVAVAIVLGCLAGYEVASASLVHLPSFGSLEETLRSYQAGGPAVTVTHPSGGWVVIAGLGVAVIYALSVLAHELGHLAVARFLGVEVASIELHAAGGFVEMEDDDWLTAGRLASIAGAGPLVTGCLALLSAALLGPLTGQSEGDTGAGVALERVLSAAFTINLLGLVVNLVPVRALDGGHLLAAARLRYRRWH